MGAKQTREEWLNEAVNRLAPMFESIGAPLPGDIRVSVGFPSRAARSRRKRHIGECWSPKHSAALRHEIFISPVLGDGLQATETLVHELVHAAVGVEHGHRGRFAKVARQIGLLPPMTQTPASPELKARLNALVTTIGPYPHAALDVTGAERKQRARLLKVVCPNCGAVDRTTASRITRGLPWCDCGHLLPEVMEMPAGFHPTRMILAPESDEDGEFKILIDPLTGRTTNIHRRNHASWRGANGCITTYHPNDDHTEIRHD
jgi:predicted RNA-binding Zn-ribbon protein involved in translation (DUF1610 family)